MVDQCSDIDDPRTVGFPLKLIPVDLGEAFAVEATEVAVTCCRCQMNFRRRFLYPLARSKNVETKLQGENGIDQRTTPNQKLGVRGRKPALTRTV